MIAEVALDLTIMEPIKVINWDSCKVSDQPGFMIFLAAVIKWMLWLLCKPIVWYGVLLPKTNFQQNHHKSRTCDSRTVQMDVKASQMRSIWNAVKSPLRGQLSEIWNWVVSSFRKVCCNFSHATSVVKLRIVCLSCLLHKGQSNQLSRVCLESDLDTIKKLVSFFLPSDHTPSTVLQSTIICKNFNRGEKNNTELLKPRMAFL